MNYEQYRLKLIELGAQFYDKKVELMKEYVNANNPYKVGDIVTDHIGSIQIEKMGYDTGYNILPCATYYGIELKKDGTPTKRGTKRHVWQSNLI